MHRTRTRYFGALQTAGLCRLTRFHNPSVQPINQLLVIGCVIKILTPIMERERERGVVNYVFEGILQHIF